MTRIVPNRAGFSLIELLIVIGIIAILIGLTLSAIQKARSAADQSMCLNNLRQIGIAAQSYHDTHRHFPSGVGSEQSEYPYLSWNARLLPFLELTGLWTEIVRDFEADRNFLDVPPHVRRGTVLPIYGCPSDARVFAPSTLVPIGVAFTSYLGNAGLNSDFRNGVLFQDSSVRAADITDGLSNTLLAGERPPSADEKLGWWYAGWGQRRDGSAEMLLGVCELNYYDPGCSIGPYQFGRGMVSNPCDAFHFWSLHSGGAQFVFADGTARFIAYSATPVMPALASRNGGDVIGSID